MDRRRLTEEDLEIIYASTDGRCTVCKKKLSFANYNRSGRRGAWHVDHSKALAKGGSNYLRNLKPACIDCNREKGTMTIRTAHGWHGYKRAPLSREKKEEIRRRNTGIGIGGGALAGGLLAGPAGARSSADSGASQSTLIRSRALPHPRGSNGRTALPACLRRQLERPD